MKTLKFFNRKQKQIILTPADLIEVLDSDQSDEGSDLDSEYLPSLDVIDSSRDDR